MVQKEKLWHSWIWFFFLQFFVLDSSKWRMSFLTNGLIWVTEAFEKKKKILVLYWRSLDRVNRDSLSELLWGGHWRHPVAECGITTSGSLSRTPWDFPPSSLGIRCGRVEGHSQVLRLLSRRFQRHGEEATLSWELRALSAHTCSLTNTAFGTMDWANIVSCYCLPGNVVSSRKE